MQEPYIVGQMLVLHVCRMNTGAFVLSGKVVEGRYRIPLTLYRHSLSNDFRHCIWSSVSYIDHTI